MNFFNFYHVINQATERWARKRTQGEPATEQSIPPADAWESVAEEASAPEPVDEAARLACKSAILAAAEAGESPEALVERLYVKYGGALDKDAMLAGARYAQRHYENRRLRLLGATGGLAMSPGARSVALGMADWRLA